MADSEGWLPYRDVVGHDLPWPLEIWRDLWSPQLGRNRSVAWVRSPGAPEGPLPLVVFLDGQNLFDPATAFGGSCWQLGECLEQLAGKGLYFVAVAVVNGGRRRLREYTPFITGRAGDSLAGATLDFVVDTVLPRIEDRTAILPGPEHRGLIGSSLGGLFALYGTFSRPDIFGLCGALSPSLQVRRREIFTFVAQADAGPRRIYLDVGTREVSHPRGRRFNSRHYSANVTAMRDLLRRQGYRRNRLLHVREPRAVHHESAWARRLPRGLQFLLDGSATV